MKFIVIINLQCRHVSNYYVVHLPEINAMLYASYISVKKNSVNGISGLYTCVRVLVYVVLQHGSTNPTFLPAGEKTF